MSLNQDMVGNIAVNLAHLKFTIYIHINFEYMDWWAICWRAQEQAIAINPAVSKKMYTHFNEERVMGWLFCNEGIQ
jgi:hypothetical protein